MVSVKLGLTYPIKSVDFANVKPEILISGIDPSGDVPRQVREAIEVAAYTFGEIDGQLDISLSQILSPVSGQPGFRDMVTSHDELLGKIRQRLGTFGKKLEELEAGVVEAVDRASGEDGE